MKKNSRMKAVLALALCIPSTAVLAETMGTVTTDGRVIMYKDGQLAQQFTGKGMLDENAFLICEGNCMMRVAGTTFTAGNHTAMAIKGNRDGVSLYIKEGRVDFTVANADKKIAFLSPYGLVTETDAFVFNAGSEQTASGFYSISESTAQIGMKEGRVILAMADGYKTINQHQSIRLAMSDVPAGGGAGSGAGTAAAMNVAPWVVAGGVTLATITAITIVSNDDDDDDGAILPSSTISAPPSPASPSR